MAAILAAEGLTRRLSGDLPVTLVDGVDLSIEEGGLVAITGPSGSGKSSLLYLLGLLDAPTAGDVRLAGQRTATLDDEARARLRLTMLGFVFQFHFLLPEFSALENVMLPMRALKAMPETRMRVRAAEILESLGLADHIGKTPDKLSGGQRQRVAIARALANRPKVLLADEPTGNLDSASTAQVLAIFRELVAEHAATIIMVTHDPGLAAAAGRRIHVIDGRLAEPPSG
ncbi:MAG TPA: ABC transporter ATP-binding protein [Beijerinckiaceae bacterium]|nr:ABC transporter ATP-binding protein [Beijerinckiaceae bacterium]